MIFAFARMSPEDGVPLSLFKSDSGGCRDAGPFRFFSNTNFFFTRILLRRIRPAPNGCERVMHRLLNSAESEFNGFCAFFFIFFPMLLRRLVTCFCKPQHRNIEHDQNRYGKKSRLYHECGPKIKKREKRSIHAVADISASQFSSGGIA